MRLLGAIAVATLVLSGQTAVAVAAPAGPDPLLAFLADPGRADMAGFNAHDTLMDQGGNPKAMFAVGADGIGGNADDTDTDMDFGEDEFVPNEGFTGIEDAASRTRWAYSRG